MTTVTKGDLMNVEDACYRIAIEQRIAELWRYRQWWRANRWAEHPLRRQETDIELRALVRLARAARRGAAAAARDYDRQVEQFYAVPFSESELRYAWGDR